MMSFLATDKMLERMDVQGFGAPERIRKQEAQALREVIRELSGDETVQAGMFCYLQAAPGCLPTAFVI